METTQECMIKNQICPWGVFDRRVLNTLKTTPREFFIPESFRYLAHADMQTPIGHGQVTFSPKEEARILQALDIQQDENVLEIGTGCGYFTALLAKQAKHVSTVDVYEDFVQDAVRKLTQQGIENVTFEVGDFLRDWSSDYQYDAIVITGSVQKIPQNTLKMIKKHGRIFVVLGDAPAMSACLFVRGANGAWLQQNLFETVTPRLLHANEMNNFQF
ncbi:MAG: protein-L-isoaspartate O-methyltransferase family protein [Gammaproteobacteria bacterium]